MIKVTPLPTSPRLEHNTAKQNSQHYSKHGVKKHPRPNILFRFVVNKRVQKTPPQLAVATRKTHTFRFSSAASMFSTILTRPRRACHRCRNLNHNPPATTTRTQNDTCWPMCELIALVGPSLFSYAPKAVPTCQLFAATHK